MARGRPAKKEEIKTEEISGVPETEGAYIEPDSNVTVTFGDDKTMEKETVIPVSKAKWSFKIKKYYDVMGFDKTSKEVYGLPDGKIPTNEDVAGMDAQTRDDLMHALIETYAPKNVKKDQSQYRNVISFSNGAERYSFVSPIDADIFDICWTPLKGHISPEIFIRAMYEHVGIQMPLFLINMKKYEL